MPYRRSKPLTQSQLREIATAFQLGEIEGLIKNIDGRFNLITAIKTSRGKFVVRLLYDLTTCERIVAVHNAITLLKTDGFPVAKPLITTKGEYYKIIDEGIIEVLQYIHHENPPNFTQLVLERAFWALAGLCPF